MTIVVRLDEIVVRQLWATPPDQFVAARNALVKQLKAAGEREQAAMVGSMRRPSWIDWALNAVAAEEPALVEAFADAADDMRAAQDAAMRGTTGVDVRGAIAELRDRSGQLSRRANKVLTAHGRPPAVPDITERLGEIAADDDALDQLRAGIVQATAAGDDDLAPPRERTTAAQPRKATTRSRTHKEPERPAPARVVAIDRRRVERDVKDAERVDRLVARDLERADTAVRLTSASVDAAAEALALATTNLERAKERLAGEETQREAVRKRKDQAASELERARDALRTL